MPANMIVFDAEYTRQQVNNLNNAKRILEESISILKKANAHRSWRCPEVSRINENLDTINKGLGRLNNGMSDTIEVLNIGVQRFQELESRAENQVSNLSTDLKEKHGFSASNYGQNGEAKLPVTQVPENDNSFTKLFLWQYSQMDKSGKAKLGNKGLSYLESLCKFYKGEKSGSKGWENLFNLGDKSVGLWTGFYDYLNKTYNGAGDIFSTVNQKRVGGLGIVGDTFGFASDIFGAIDKIKSENLGAAGITGEVIGLGGYGLNLWKDIEEIKHIGDTATNITTKTGLYSPLSLWTTFGETVISTGSQAFKSIEKYSADGQWDLGDTGRTGIEMGVSGLYTMVDKLSFGGLSTLGNVTGFKPENISRDIENWSYNIGKRAGNYILNDTGLCNAYKNAGPIGKTAITFHAAVQSGIQSAVDGIGNWFKSLWNRG